MSDKLRLVSVYTGTYLEAQIVKGRLENEGIPSMLRYEGAGLIYGVTVDGLGEARVMVPEPLADEARQILAHQDYDQVCDEPGDQPMEQS